MFTSETMVRVMRYLDESRGNAMDDIWVDIPPVNAVSKARTGYPPPPPPQKKGLIYLPEVPSGLSVHAVERRSGRPCTPLHR